MASFVLKNAKCDSNEPQYLCNVLLLHYYQYPFIFFTIFHFNVRDNNDDVKAYMTLA